MFEIYDFKDVKIEKQLTGIYCIFNTKYYYVGQSLDIRKRWRNHRRKCEINSHENEFVQRIYNKYLETDPFKFRILELCEDSVLTKQETFWIKEFKRNDLICMNLCTPGNAPTRDQASRNKIIYQFDSIGNLLNTWISIPVASINTGVSESLIAACLQKRSKHGAGFIWSYDENINLENYAIYRKGDDGYIPYNIKKVLQFSLTGEFIKEWDSIIEVSEKLKIDNGAITHVCKRELGSTGGFIWRYDGDIVTEEDLKRVQKIIPCCKYDKEGNLVQRFDSCKEAAKEWGCFYQSIHDCCKKRRAYKGFLYLYEGDSITNEDLWKMYCGKYTPVIQILEDGSEKLYHSCEEAAIILGLKRGPIISCMTGHSKTGCGYKWRRATIEDWLKYKNKCLH